MRTPLIWIVAAGVVAGGAICAATRDLSASPETSGPQIAAARPAVTTPTGTQPDAADYATLVAKYCVTCHSDRLKTGGLSLQNLDLADVPAHADVWEKVT